MKTPQQLANALITHYQKLYKKRYGKIQDINRYREKWGMMDMIESWGYDGTKELIEYYFKTGERDHSLPNFYNKSDALVETKRNAERDKERRRDIMEQTRLRIEQEEQQLT